MRYAIFSDIHANLVAWNAALADMEELEADVLVCLGDVVGYGPCPQQVLDAIRAHTDHFVVGNHDAAASGAIDTSLFNDNARTVIEWTREQLNEDAVQFLLNVPLSLETEDILFVHAEIEEPGRFGYIDGITEATENFASNQHFVTFVGHTHHPTIFELNSDGGVQQLPDDDATLDSSKRYIVNVGSVGEPRNPDDLRSRYVIYDSDTCEVYFRRIEFDPEAYRADLLASGLEISPYFLSVVDHYIQSAQGAPNEDELRALTHDMETPLEVSGSHHSQPQRLVLSAEPSGVQKPKPKPKPVPNQVRKVGAMPFVIIFTSAVALFGVGAYLLFGPDDPPPEPIAVAAQDPEVKAIPQPEVAPPPPEPTKEELSLREGLVAQWKLNDSPGTRWHLDESGNDLDLLAEGAESIAKGVDGRAYKFDGANDRLLTGPNPFDGRKLGQAAISGWFSTTSAGTKREMVVAVQTMFVVEFDAGKFYAKFADGVDARASSPDNLRNGTWRHFVAQNDGKTTELYVDGELVDSIPQAIDPLEKVVDRPITIGAASHAEESWFDGFVDEVALWDRTLTEEEILHLYKIGGGAEAPQDVLASVPKLVPAPKPPPPPPKPPPPIPPKPKPDPAATADLVEKSTSKLKEGLLAYWRFDESAAVKQARDLTGNGFNLAVHAATPGQAGQLDKAYRFTPGPKSNLASKPNIIGKSKQLAISGWFRRAGKTRAHLVTVEGIIDAYLFDDTFEAYFNGKRPGAAKSGLGAPDNVWRHFVIQNTGAETILYLNGTERKRVKQKIADLDKQDRPLRIGANWNATGSAFNGWIDEIAIWGRALTAEEVAALHAAGNGAFSFLKPPTPLAHWKMDEQSGARGLRDSIGEHHLGRLAGGAQVAAIAPNPIPQTGATNPNAQRGGAWAELELTGAFQLSAKSDFTLEGWITSPPVPEITFIAGTRTGDANSSQGWHIDLRPPTSAGGNGAIGFLFDNGPAGQQAIAADVPIFDGKPHHFAVVWASSWGTAEEGKMLVFVDRKWYPQASIPLADIPDKQANRFQIGMPGIATNGIVLDEVRFTPAVLRPASMLIGRKGSLETAQP